MGNVLYSKYNRTRIPKYQTCTKIIETEAGRVVVKSALTEEAKGYIAEFPSKYEIIKNSYANLTPIAVELSNGTAVFPYVEGQSLAAVLEQEQDVESRMLRMKEFLAHALEIRPEYIRPFEITKEFTDVFGSDVEQLYGMPAAQGADIDLIFENIIQSNDGWNVIDYEWTYDLLIPVDFIKFRCLYYYYCENNKVFQEKDVDEYMAFFDIDEKNKDIFLQMDDSFQQLVHGKNRKNIYTSKYMLKTHDLYRAMYQNQAIDDELEDVDQKNQEITDKARHITNLEAMIEQKKAENVQFEKTVETLSNEIEDYENKIEDYENKIEDYENKIEDYKKEVGDCKYEIGEYAKIVVDREAKIQKLTQERDLYAAQRDQYQKQYEEIQNSRIWRSTKVVRKTFNIPKCIKEHGVKYTVRYALTGKSIPVQTGAQYKLNCDDFVLSEDERKKQKNMHFSKEYKFSILVPLYNTPEKFLREMIESVQSQTYGNWELCLADGSDDEHREVGKICKAYAKQDKRVLYKKLEKNGGISENTNACIEMASGDYIALFDHDDLLTEDALYEVITRINNKEHVQVVYTDEDKFLYNAKTETGEFVEPYFKSDFNLDLLRTNNYICHFFVVEKNIVNKIGGFRKEYDGSQDFDFIFRCIEQVNGSVEHIAKILYHWRMHANSTAANPQSKMYCYDAGKRAIESHLERMGVTAVVEMTEHWGLYRVTYPVSGTPLISIIIPNKDEVDTLKKCIESIVNKTKYTNYEVIIIENNSTTTEIFEYYKQLERNEKIKVLYWKGEFNYSAINNFGVKNSHGEYVLLLNNDVEVSTGDWMERMLSNCQRKEVGITGAKLLYPDNTVQHCGVVVGLGGIAGHIFVGIDANHPGNFGRAIVQQNLSAVTAACLMVSRKIYDEVGGLEEALKVAFNDVDFCLKVRKAGYLVVMNPDVRLYHYESKSRGAEDTPEKQERFASEIRYMAEHWTQILKDGDPYYNKNLTLVRGDFSVKEKGEVSPRYV